MKFDIWTEGYIATGMEGIPARAQKLASNIEAESFIEAAKKWYRSEPNASSRFGDLDVRNGIVYLWGCRLFDNEQDARKVYG